ncbi:MAG: hypothetical protein ACRCX2_12820 [Paraclostridium sp.]
MELKGYSLKEVKSGNHYLSYTGIKSEWTKHLDGLGCTKTIYLTGKKYQGVEARIASFDNHVNECWECTGVVHMVYRKK